MPKLKYEFFKIYDKFKGKRYPTKALRNIKKFPLLSETFFPSR